MLFCCLCRMIAVIRRFFLSHGPSFSLERFGCSGKKATAVCGNIRRFILPSAGGQLGGGEIGNMAIL
jgi:hypothetical protein